VQYLESVKPLLDEANYKEMQQLVQEFQVRSITVATDCKENVAAV